MAPLPRPSSLLKSSTLYFAFALILLSVSVVYGIVQWKILKAEQLAIVDNEQRTRELQTLFSKDQEQFKTLGDNHARTVAEFRKKIGRVLPEDENYTELTRQLDNYFAEHDIPSNPIFQSSLRFGKGVPLEGMPVISALPISMNLEATRDNFFKFLEFVENSGSLESEVRLMEVHSIQLNFPEGGEVLKDPKQKLNFTVEMSAYYQTPKVARQG